MNTAENHAEKKHIEFIRSLLAFANFDGRPTAEHYHQAVTHPLMTEKEAAARLSVSCEQLRKWRRLGIELPYHRIGNNIRYSVVDVILYEHSKKITPTG